jgi:uncharacterized protein (DUF4415 family)
MQKRKSKATEPEWNDNPEWTAEAVKKVRPVREAHPDLAEWSEKRKRGQRGPQKMPTKVPVKLRVDPAVLEAYKATGSGYQTRMAEVLRKGVLKIKRAS